MRLYIMKCSKERNPNCKSDEQIEKFLNQIQFDLWEYEATPKFSKKNLNPLESIFIREKILPVNLNHYTRYDLNISTSIVEDKLNRWN